MNQELTTKQKNVRNLIYLVMLLLLIFKYLIFKYSVLIPSYLFQVLEIAFLCIIFLIAKKNNIINKTSSVFYLIIAIVFITLFIFRNSPITNN
jgi:hypothetical protein